jgi:hypothetical protein
MKTLEELKVEFPNLFDPTLSYMYDIPVGWVTLVSLLLNSMRNITWCDSDGNHICALSSIEIKQIKQKFGALRFYYGIIGHIDVSDIRDMNGQIRFAEYISTQTCQECGAPGKMETLDGWIEPLCAAHLALLTKEHSS